MIIYIPLQDKELKDAHCSYCSLAFNGPNEAILRQGQLRSPIAFEYGKNGKMLNGGKLAGNRQMDRRFLLIKIMVVSVSVPGLYPCILP